MLERGKPNRRTFLLSLAALGGGMSFCLPPTSSAKSTGIKLGFDNFSIRGKKWKADQLIEYAARQKVDTLLLSDLNVYESFEESYLKSIKEKADKLGIELHVGTGGVVPTSSRFIDRYGSAEDHLRLLIRIAQTLGSPVARCFLGSSAERKGDGGIFYHIESAISTFKKVRNIALDADVKLGIENHAGDMQAWEIAYLIEEAGPEFVGATMDSGNATWTLEDPMVNLEILGPYAVSTGIRDSAIWESENGAFVEWTNIGEGDVDWKAYVQRYSELCPSTPFILEIISYIGPREFPYLNKDFWKPYPKVRAREFAQFVAMAEKGKPVSPPADRPEDGVDKQFYDLEKSLRYCKEVLGLGLKS